jgi:hypothetical protein
VGRAGQTKLSSSSLRLSLDVWLVPGESAVAQGGITHSWRFVNKTCHSLSCVYFVMNNNTHTHIHTWCCRKSVRCARTTSEKDQLCAERCFCGRVKQASKQARTGEDSADMSGYLLLVFVRAGDDGSRLASSFVVVKTQGRRWTGPDRPSPKGGRVAFRTLCVADSIRERA